ncbi:MAG: hypothetical protein ABI166_02080 [Mucilaginibacter sp.]
MKNSVIYLVMMVAVCFTVSCSTKNNPTPTSTTSKFTINGNSFTQVSGADSVTTLDGKSYNVLGVTGQSADKSASAALIIFWSGSAKPQAGSYAAVDDITKLGGGQVAILIIDKVTTAKQGIYGTTAGSSLAVAVSSSGKVSVTMPNMVIKGSNVDNTDPKNSVVTDVTGSISGTASEQ